MIAKDIFKFTPFRIAVLGSVITALSLVILVGAAIQRNNAVATLQEDISAIEANFSERKQADLTRITDLEETLAEAQSEVQVLENAFPEPGKPFPLYHQAQEIALRSQVTLLEISQRSQETLETSRDTIQATKYQMLLQGNPNTCITFIENMEQVGTQTISIQDIRINPSQERCELNAQILQIP